VGGVAVTQQFYFGPEVNLDPDAARYIRAVQAADGAGLFDEVVERFAAR
jgi:hypothetical protein